MKYVDGFTQTELLTTLLIISVISALALPSFSDFLNQEKNTATINALYDHLLYSRSTAILTNTTVTICASKNNVICETTKDWSNKNIMIFQDGNSNGKREDKEKVLRLFQLEFNKNVLTWSSFGNKSYLQWQPSGSTYYQNGNFNYCPANKNLRHAKKIILNSAGRIYFGADRNHDGIQEGTDGKNMKC